MASKPSSSSKVAGAGVKPEGAPAVALAAIVSAKKQKEVAQFLDFFVTALDRNSGWMNNVIAKQANFQCALMVGAGPNRYQMQEIIYPTPSSGEEQEQVKLEVELRDSDDYDKIAIAALLNLSNQNLSVALDFVKSRLHQNPTLRDDLLMGKSMGVTYAVLKPFSEKQYRLMERIPIDSSQALAVKKTVKDSKSPIFKRFRRF